MSNELRNLKISFISLVKKAANKKRFCIVKSDDDGYSSESEIIKMDEDKKLVTSVVYEPDTPDTQGDFMTAEEIEKAAHDFLVNGKGVDIQHDFKKANAQVVESWVTKSETVIGGQIIKKGTWMATTKVSDDGVWELIKKGEITGFSMGGTGTKVKVKKSEENSMDEIKKMLEEILKANQTEVITKQVEDFKAQVEKAATKEELVTITKSIEKLNEEIVKMSTVTAGAQEDTVEKAAEEYATQIRKADLSTGSALVPKTLSNQLVKDMKEIAPFFGDGRVITAKGTTVRVPQRFPNTTSSAYSKGEGEAGTLGGTNFDEVEISKGVIQSTIPVTDELRRDSQFDIVALIREYGTEDIAEAIALRTYSGVIDTKNKIEGFTKNTEFATRATAVTTDGAVTFDDLMAAKKEVKPQYWKGAKWYVSKDAYFAMKTMKDLNNRPLWQDSLITGAPSTFDGYPVVLCWQMDENFPVLFSNFGKMYTYFLDYQLESELDRFATEGKQNEILRARLGGKVTNIQAGYMLKKKA